jgi:hypothetical protein
MRLFSAALVIGGLVSSMMAGPAAAQAGTGTVSGRIVDCRIATRLTGNAELHADLDSSASLDGAAEFGELDSGMSLNLGADARPPLERVPAVPEVPEVAGLRPLHRVPLATVGLPNIEVKLLGGPLTVHTDAAGRFVLHGVPASQPVTVSVQWSTRPNIALQLQDLVLTPGQTLDIGALSLSGCAAATVGQSASAASTLRPAVTIVVDQIVLGDDASGSVVPWNWDTPLADSGIQSALTDAPAADIEVVVEGGPTE